MRRSDADIVLVEDNVSDAELITHCLRDAGISDSVKHIHDGVEALDYLFCRGAYTDRSFDAAPRLVLLDLKVPKLDGFQILAELKADQRTRAIPVVLLTSSRVERDVAKGYLLGANSYVQKPVNFEGLRDVVQSLGRYWLSVNEAVPQVALQQQPR